MHALNERRALLASLNKQASPDKPHIVKEINQTHARQRSALVGPIAAGRLLLLARVPSAILFSKVRPSRPAAPFGPEGAPRVEVWEMALGNPFALPYAVALLLDRHR
jgi:hypothetical protein